MVAALVAALVVAGVAASGAGARTSGVGPITGAYLLAFHACDGAQCTSPRSHLVYLAESNDGATWTLVPGWVPYTGSVPDVVRRGDLLYLYAVGVSGSGGGAGVRVLDLKTGLLGSASGVTISGFGGSVVDPSALLDDQGRIVLFFLVSDRTPGDPAQCRAGETTCVRQFASATEAAGGDGVRFAFDPGSGASVTLGGGLRIGADPDVFFDGTQWVMYISHGPSTSVWTSATMRGVYTRIGSLTENVGGVPAGHHEAATGRVWSYTHVGHPTTVIRRAVHAGYGQLAESAWSVVVSAATLGLSSSWSVASPGIAANVPGVTPALIAAPASTAPVAKPTAAATAKTTAKAKPKTTITCVKGNLKKKVTAVSPKCPAGYTRR